MLWRDRKHNISIHLNEKILSSDSQSFLVKSLSCRGESSPCSTAECEALDATASLQCWLENSGAWLGGPLRSPGVGRLESLARQ